MVAASIMLLLPSIATPTEWSDGLEERKNTCLGRKTQKIQSDHPPAYRLIELVVRMYTLPPLHQSMRTVQSPTNIHENATERTRI